MRRLWADLAKARRELIDSNVLNGNALPSRFWYCHLFWICSFVKSAVDILGRRVVRTCVTLYCKSVDRIFGSSRYLEYLENRRKEYQRLQAKIRDLRAEQQGRAERRFEREAAYQALTNPHFVETNHTHQDR